MSGYQDDLAMRSLPLVGVFNLVAVNYYYVMTVLTAAAMVVLCWHHFISWVTGYPGRLKDIFVNDLGLTATYVVITTMVYSNVQIQA